MGPEASVESELEDSGMSFQTESRDIQVSKDLIESMLIFDDRSESIEPESESESESESNSVLAQSMKPMHSYRQECKVNEM